MQQRKAEIDAAIRAHQDTIKEQQDRITPTCATSTHYLASQRIAASHAAIKTLQGERGRLTE